jgi:O-antigen ligase
MEPGIKLCESDAHMSPGMWVVGLILVFAPLLEGGTTHVAAMVIRLLVLVLAALYFTQNIRAGVMTVPRLPLDLSITVFLILAGSSAIGSDYPHQSFQWLMVLGVYAALLYFIVFFINGWKDVIRLVAVLIAVAVGESTLSLVQFFMLGLPRPNGTFFNPNFLAGYLGAVFAIVLGAGMCLRWPQYARFNVPRLFQPIGVINAIPARCLKVLLPGIWVAMLSLLAVAILITGSRGGLSAAIIAAMCVLILQLRKRGIAVIAIVVVAVLVIPNPLSSRIEAEHKINPESYARWRIWQQSGQAVLQNPLGYGLGLYQYIYPRYAFPIEGQIVRYGKVAQTAHNEYIQIGVELGLFGLTVFLFGMLQLLKEIRLVLRFRLRRWQRGMIVGACGAVTGVLAQAAFDSNLHEPGIVVVLIVAVAVLCSVRRMAGAIGSPAVEWMARPRWAWAGCSLIVLLFIGIIVLKDGVGWLFFESGTRAQANRDVDKAIAAYQTAVFLEPGKALYHSSLAAVQFQRFQQTSQAAAAQAAIDELLAAMERNSLDGRLPGILGYVYGRVAAAASNDLAGRATREALEVKAILAYERAKELEPFSVLHRLELARLRLARGEREKAFNEADEALELEPNCLIVREWLAHVYLNSGTPDHIERARHQIREILDRQKRYAEQPKNALELKFMTVHAANLMAELNRVAQLKRA